MMTTSSFARHGRMRKRKTVVLYRYIAGAGGLVFVAGAVIAGLSFAGLLTFGVKLGNSEFESSTVGLATLGVGAFIVLVAVVALVLTAVIAGQTVCDGDDGDTVPIDKHLRPGDGTYYRCRGHSPPHCYDREERTIACP